MRCLALKHLVLIPLFGLALSAPAADLFRFGQRKAKLEDLGEVTCYVLGWGADEYSFLPPRGWRVKPGTAENQVTVIPPNSEAAITIRVLPAGTPMAPNPTAEAWRQEVLRKFDHAILQEEFPCYTGVTNGSGFEVHWLANNQYPMLSRIGFTPINGATLQFELTARADTLPAFRQAFGSLLTSFHQTTDAKK
jgi:hypothetical protein